jgi:hypothetical protein
LQVQNCKTRIASPELQDQNCKSRITSPELQVLLILAKLEAEVEAEYLSLVLTRHA